MEKKPLTIIRCFAFIIDVLALALFASLITAVIGLFISVEENFTVILSVALGVAMAALFLEEYLLQTSIGKWIFSYCLRGDDGGAISIRQSVLRSLTKPLFPIEGLVLVFNKSKKRIGDMMAKTQVDRMEISWGKKVFRFIGGLAAVYLAINGVLMVSAVAYRNTDIFETAVGYYEENKNNPDFKDISGLNRLPEIVRIQNEFGIVVFRAQKDDQPIYLQLNLKKQTGQWQVVHHRFTRKSMGRGYGISYDSSGFNVGATSPVHE